MTFPAKIKNLLTEMRRNYFPTRPEATFSAFYAKQNPKRFASSAAPVIAVQSVEDLYFFGIFGAVVTGLRKETPVRVDQYLTRSLRTGASLSVIKPIAVALAHNWISDWKWSRLYRSFADGVGVRAGASLAPAVEWRCFRQAWTTWRALRTKDDLARLEIRGIPVGDLVGDTFIRWKPWPEILVKDRYLLVVLRQTLRDIEKAFRYFENRRPEIYFTSYTSYIQHGIPVRIALALGIRVISLGNYQELSKNLTFDDQGHLARHWNYRKEFAQLSKIEQESKLALADEKLAARMCGEIDNSIAYMRWSPYAAKSDAVPDVKDAVIIYLPDFYDSVHVYRWSIFHDYWDWICFTIETLNRENIPFFIKTHPNGFADTKIVDERIKKCYPNVRFVPSSITTKQLVDRGMVCGVSPRGTILSELTYLGIPGIAAGDHPHADFDLTPPPRTLEEYRRQLANARNLPRDREKMRKLACEFYCMHNLRLDADDTALRDRIPVLVGMTANPRTIDPATLIAAFETLAQERGLHKLVKRWAAELMKTRQDVSPPKYTSRLMEPSA